MTSFSPPVLRWTFRHAKRLHQHRGVCLHVAWPQAVFLDACTVGTYRSVCVPLAIDNDHHARKFFGKVREINKEPISSQV